MSTAYPGQSSVLDFIAKQILPSGSAITPLRYAITQVNDEVGDDTQLSRDDKERIVKKFWEHVIQNTDRPDYQELQDQWKRFKLSNQLYESESDWSSSS